MHSIFWKALRDLRWQVFWYGVGFAALAAMVVYVYPSYHDQLVNFEIPEALKPLVGEADYATPKGFLSAEFFSWIPILGVIFAIMAGTSALAGEEANGTLDLLLAQPISRRRLAVEKLAAFAISAILISGVTCFGWLLSVPFVRMDISYSALLGGTLQIVPIMLFFGVFSMWTAALLPDRRQATGFVTAFAVFSFFVNYLAELVDVLTPLRWMSPFYYSNTSNSLSGVDPARTALLLGATVLFSVLTIVAFQRREIGVRGTGIKLPSFAIPPLKPRHA